jgi:DNA processing protein
MEIKLGGKNYPTNLAEIKYPPKALHIEGSFNLKWFTKSVAVVGSRANSSYGKKVTEQFVEMLVKKGYIFISGLARGIDSIAHWQAIRSGGITVAVLGHGLDFIYPRENEKLAGEIIKNGGCLISEYKNNIGPAPQNFVARNRIIAGLATKLLVIEGGEKSGTWITAKNAIEEGREVFCIPGEIDKPTSFVPNHLIQMGAQIALTFEDICS